MAHYTREQLLGLVEQGGRDIPGYPQAQDIPTPVFPVSTREKLYHAVRDAGRGVTRSEAARLIQRKPGDWINHHLDALVRQGYLTRTEGVHYNGMPVYYYKAID